MDVKYKKSEMRPISQFDLIGDDEVSLCKAFAYLLAEKNLFQIYMKKLFNINYAKSKFNDLSVETEHHYPDIGRTDIELKFDNYHIIFECKVRGGYVGKEQVKKYIDCFDKNTNNFLCFLTENIPPTTLLNNLNAKNVKVCYFNWGDIISALDSETGQITKDFINYYERTYKMSNVKEVAVRDLRKGWTTDLFCNNNLYQTKPVTGKPLYFSPYFSKGGNEVGFVYLSKILGVATGKPTDVSDDLLATFSEDKNLIQKWKEGLSAINQNTTRSEMTIYFLDEPVKFPKPLLKDSGNQKGRGKDWVAAMIPPNRTIEFQEFIKRL